MLYRSHEPQGYQCPFCELVNELPFSETNLCAPTDLIYQTEQVAAIMACDGFGNFGGHVMIIPTAHLESLYDLDEEIGAAIMRETRRIALAMKLAWNPDGTSTRQHNEPAGNQHVWHYHQHIFPRYWDDELYRQLRHRVPVEDRALKAQQLRAVLFSDAHPQRLFETDVQR